MGDVKNLVIARMNRMFGPPANIADGKIPAYLAEYHGALGTYTDDVLERAMDWVRDNHVYPGWPTPGVVNQQCKRLMPTPAPVTTKGWDDNEFVPKSEVSREYVRRMHEECKRALADLEMKKMPRPGAVDYVPMDVSRPAMERNEKRWREAERVGGISDLSRRMTGERDG